MMRAVLLGILCALVAVVMPFEVGNASTAPRGRYVVVLAPSASPSEVARNHGVPTTYLYRHAITGFATHLSAAKLRTLRQDERVLSVVRDRRVHVLAQQLPTGVDRVGADLSPTADIDGANDRPVDVDIAILDTGVDTEHPDLNVVGGINCVAPEPHLGRYDDLYGHGTHVAGTAAAIDNDGFVVGVAPGARIWSVRVLNGAGLGFTSQIICGLDWVTQHADVIDVANESFGGAAVDNLPCPKTKDPEHLATCAAVDAGITFAVSAGNSSANVRLFSPANYDEVITVSALADFDGEPGGRADQTCGTVPDVDDTLASFSNFGEEVDLIAPGRCILSTASTHDSRYGKSGLVVFSGTSMAAPHVTGGAALYIMRHPGASPAEVKAALIRAGTFDWNDSSDPDGEKEPLLNVAGF